VPKWFLEGESATVVGVNGCGMLSANRFLALYDTVPSDDAAGHGGAVNGGPAKPAACSAFVSFHTEWRRSNWVPEADRA
jgi:hypothetical protein